MTLDSGLPYCPVRENKFVALHFFFTRRTTIVNTHKRVHINRVNYV